MSREIELKQDDFLVSKTDIKGKTIYCNKAFAKIAGYKIEEIVGHPHNLVRHKDMPRVTFKILWDLVKEKDEFFGFVKNRTATNQFYWVFAYVAADLDDRGNIVSYTSFRRKASPSAIEVMAPLYAKLKEIEVVSGVDASLKELQKILAEKEVSYKEFVTKLQLGESL